MRGGSRKRKFGSKRGRIVLAFVVVLLLGAVPALAHVERASYWPSPNAGSADGIPTGGKVPEVRNLFTALDPKPAGATRVVCQGNVPAVPKSLRKGGKKPTKGQRRARRAYTKKLHKNPSLKRLDASVRKVTAPKKGKKGKKGAASAKKKKKKKNGTRGYTMRPSEPNVKVGKKAAKKLVRFNEKLLKRCKFDSIQDAVNASGNNDRVTVMPGIYTEPKSRSAPSNDPKCASLKETNDRGNTGALSYNYQLTCPNDQNLIAVLGRAAGGPAPQPPLLDRHNLPDEGACVRCNLQIEGSGIKPEDVTIDAGNVASGNAGPAKPVKDVGIRADRADGFVATNLTTRHAAEHGIYVHETDGYTLDHFKAFYNEEYGVLTFTSDHGLMQDCEAKGSGDSGLYPGAAPETGEQTVEGTQRFNTEIRDCDMHHNTAGYSGTDANGVWVHNNDFYDNANGFTTDVFTAAGHPGFPQDSDLIENNEFYSNNFNPYLPGSDIDPIVPMPVGTGMWIAGGNANVVRNNRIWDNWRRGTMLFAVPDQFVCDNPAHQIPDCDPTPGNTHTSFRNRYYGNKMGQAPNGKADANGTDFWWDQQGIISNLANTANCWYDNTGKDGSAASVTGIPSPSGIAPNNLPSDCASSPATGSLNGQSTELIRCLTAAQGDANACPWYATPPEP